MTGEGRKARIITFYSYKGGTGRSLALANVAWVLASNGKRVLCIDWDLEAPGLHRYFAPFLIDADLFSSDGVIDFVWAISEAATTPALGVPSSSSPVISTAALGSPAMRDFAEFADARKYVIHLEFQEQDLAAVASAAPEFELFPPGGALDIVPAGRQGSSYAERVNTFDWDNFYERIGGGKALNAFFERLRAHYDFILVDSRTGVSDTSGICTVQLPDALVVFFTLNKQSMRGAEAVALSVREQRPELPIFPVPTRVDPFESDKMEAALRHAKRVFTPFLAHLEQAKLLASGTRDEYWGDVEFPYQPFYSYEEVLAPFKDERGRKATLLAASTRLAARLSREPVIEPPAIDDRLRALTLKSYGYDSGQSGTAAVRPSAPQSARPKVAVARGVTVTRALARAARSLTTASWRTLLPVAVALAVVVYSALARLRDTPSRLHTRADSIAELFGRAAIAPADRRRLFLALYESGHDNVRKDSLLRGVDLSDLDLSNQNLRGADLRSAKLHGTRFVNTALDSANLSGANLTGADLTNATLRAANLSGTQVANAILNGANLYQAMLDNVALDSAITNAQTVLWDSTPGPYRREEDTRVGTDTSNVSRSAPLGFVWIGNYNRQQGAWEKVRISDSANRAIAQDPELLPLRATYVLRGDLTLRQTLPKNDRDYFNGVIALGWIPRGSTVTLLNKPVGFTRPAGRTQYWARVLVDSVRVQR